MFLQLNLLKETRRVGGGRENESLEIEEVKGTFSSRGFTLSGALETPARRTEEEDTASLCAQNNRFVPEEHRNSPLLFPGQLITFSSSDTRSSKSAILGSLNPAPPVSPAQSALGMGAWLEARHHPAHMSMVSDALLCFSGDLIEADRRHLRYGQACPFKAKQCN